MALREGFARAPGGVSILPFMDQTPIYNQMNFNGSFGGGLSAANAFTGNTFLSGLLVSAYRCPSSTLNPFDEGVYTFTDPNNGTTYSGNYNNPGRGMHIQYVGISGGAGPAATISWTPQGGYYDCQRGYSCDNGLLMQNETRSVRDATDGTSNTMLVGEQSGRLFGANVTSNYYGGWHGARRTWIASNTAQCQAPGERDHWQTGTTCLRQPPNSRGLTDAGSRTIFHNNTTLTSEHSGGLLALLADGAVRFLSNNIDFQTYKKLAICADGQVIGEF